MVQATRHQYRRTFIRQWRLHRGLTLERLAERVGTTHASLSRIERGIQPYAQPLLEAIAEAHPEDIWSVWDHAKPGQRRQIIEIAKTLLKTAS
jgi:transcriptional regulator with XRE-family HTH domain